MDDDHSSDNNQAIMKRNEGYDNDPIVELVKKMMRTNKEKFIKTSISVHYDDTFIIKRHFDEFADKIYHVIGLQVQSLDDGPNKQALI